MGDPLKNADAHTQQIAALRNRLTQLSAASLRINESLDLDTVLQEILDSARSLTDAHYGVIATFDQAGQVEDFLASGLTAEETQQLWETTKEMTFCKIPGPRRVRNFASYTRVLGIPQFCPPTKMSACLGAPIRHRGEDVGNIYLAKSKPRQEFTQEDEETLVTFASQAAQVIFNARQLPRRAASQSRSRNPDQHLAGGRGRLRRPNRRAGVHQSGGQKDYRGITDAGMLRGTTPRRAHRPACRWARDRAG